MRILIMTLLIAAGLVISAQAQTMDKPALDNDSEFGYEFAQVDTDTPPVPPPDEFGPLGGPFGGERGFGPGSKRFERMRARKMMELLDIDKEQHDKLMAIARKYRENKHEVVRTHIMTTDTLATGLREGSLSEDDILRLVDKLQALELRKLEVTNEFHNEARAILTAEQFGRLVVFDMRFETKILGRLNDMRRRHPDWKPGDGPKPWRGKPDENDKDSI